MKRENVGAREGEEGSGLGYRRRKALLLMPDCSHMGDGFAPFLCVTRSLFCNECHREKSSKARLEWESLNPFPLFQTCSFFFSAMEIGLNLLDMPSPLHTSRHSFIQAAIGLFLSLSFSLITFVSLFLLPLLLICIFQKELGKRSLALALCLLFILVLFLTCSVRSFFPSPAFHPPVRFSPFLVSNKFQMCFLHSFSQSWGGGVTEEETERREAWRARGKSRESGKEMH